MNADRFLITQADILDAARYRLRGWTPSQIEEGVAAAASAIASQDGLQSAGEHLVRAKDRGDPWSAFCALICLLADTRGDTALLYRAGYEVIDGYRQAQRAAGPKASDALNELIRGRMDVLPDAGPRELWDEFVRLAEDAFHAVLVGFDEAAGVLSYEPRPGAKLADIDFVAFRRRVQRISRGQVRQQPARVAPHAVGCSP